MTEVVKIDGAPGVGKSTRLFEYVEQEAAQGASLGEIYYLTFARSGREESAERLGRIFNAADDEELRKRAKTFHGAAWVACAINDLWEDPDQQIIQQGSDDDVYRKFAARHGLEYRGDTNPQEQDEPEAGGDKLYRLNDYLTYLRRDPEQHRFAPFATPWNHETTVKLLDAWSAFKRAGRPEVGLPLYEHTDYVDAAIRNEWAPPGRILFIDEFQDLSPQEYLLYKTWRDSGQFDRIYIAGDANQSIYSFRAAEPRYFEETDVDEYERRKKSYRCPAEVVDVARRVLESCPETDPKGFSAARSGGHARSVSLRDESALAAFTGRQLETHEENDSGTAVMLLARTNHQVRQVARALRKGGVPYEWLGRRRGVWQRPLPAILTALRAMYRGAGGIPRESANALLAHAPDKKHRKEALGDSMGDVYKVESMWQAWPDCDRVEEIVQKLDLEDYQLNVLESAAGTPHNPREVRIGTIHSAKGLEAPSVLLFDGYTQSLEERYYDGEITAEEHRLYYVGATRASESLHIVSDYFSGTTFPGLSEGLAVAGGAN